MLRNVPHHAPVDAQISATCRRSLFGTHIDDHVCHSIGGREAIDEAGWAHCLEAFRYRHCQIRLQRRPPALPNAEKEAITRPT